MNKKPNQVIFITEYKGAFKNEIEKLFSLGDIIPENLKFTPREKMFLSVFELIEEKTK